VIFFVIAKAGRKHEVDELHDMLAPFGILQFVRSGRIAVSKEAMPITELLKKYEDLNLN